METDFQTLQRHEHNAGALQTAFPCWSMGTNEDDIAKDILQEVFIKIHLQINSLKEETKLRSWIYQITRNTIIDYYRTQKTHDALPEWLKQPEPDDEDIIRQELSLCLAPMIKQLPEKYRSAIQLSELEGKNQKEIAERENLSLSGEKSRVKIGRKLIKSSLYDCCTLEVNNKNQVTHYKKKKKIVNFAKNMRLF